ncbi:MAG: hypothetical protein R6V62_05725 [Candidatus Fermentibacteraceae bacterium]
MLHDRPAGFWVFLAVAGMVCGTVFGEAVSALLPDTSYALRQFFSGSAGISLGPLGFDLFILSFRLEEIAFRVNIMTFAGLLIVGFLYRWF